MLGDSEGQFIYGCTFIIKVSECDTYLQICACAISILGTGNKDHTTANHSP